MISVVITSINSPTKAVRKFSSLVDVKTIVVGDRKSPASYTLNEVDFLGIDDERNSQFLCSRSLPENHYCRKMLGYLVAVQNGSDVIIDTDDDNVPKSDFAIERFDGDYEVTKRDAGFINVYEHFTDSPIWPRGLPLDQILSSRGDKSFVTSKRRNIQVGVFQGLADGEPDVDAIYRLTDNRQVNFEDKQPIVLDGGTWSPFNSQNTAFRKELFQLLYLPTSVTFRFTDILRSFVAQPIMWNNGFHLGFSKASVVQERNPHNYFEDFLSEVPMYESTIKVAELVQSVVKPGQTIRESLELSYQALQNIGVVRREELNTLSNWLDDFEIASSQNRK